MTRVIVYSAALVVFVATTAMTFAAIIMPHWITVDMPWGSDDRVKQSYGLHRSCSTITGVCVPFPDELVCSKDRYFCTLWRSTGFLMSLTAALELVTIVAYLVILAGGKQKRTAGWKLLALLLTLVGLIQCAAMSIVAYVFDNDAQFFEPWKLDSSFVLCTVSWALTLLTSAGIVLSAYAFPAEDGYELIPSERQH